MNDDGLPHDIAPDPSGVLWFTMPLVEGESLRDQLVTEQTGRRTRPP